MFFRFFSGFRYICLRFGFGFVRLFNGGIGFVGSNVCGSFVVGSGFFCVLGGGLGSVFGGNYVGGVFGSFVCVGFVGSEGGFFFGNEKVIM